MDKLIEWNQIMDFKEIIPISALNGDNVDELIETIKQDYQGKDQLFIQKIQLQIIQNSLLWLNLYVKRFLFHS